MHYPLYHVPSSSPNDVRYTWAYRGRHAILVSVITVLVGENSATRNQAQQKLVAEFVATHGDMALERLDGEEATYEQMIAAVESVPFLAERKLVLLRNPGANKDFAEHIAALPDSVADSNDVCIVEAKLDKRSAYYKALKKFEGFHEQTVLDAQGMARFAEQYAKEQGGAMPARVASFLVQRLAGAEQLLLQHEIDKLLAYDTTITQESIELLTDQQPQSTIFELLEAAFAGNAKKTTALYDEQRALKVEPQQIVAMLAWQLHIFAIVKMAGERSPEEVAKQAKLHPFVVKKSQAIVRRMSRAELTGHIRQLRELDVRMKSEGIIADEAVQYYLLQLTA